MMEPKEFLQFYTKVLEEHIPKPIDHHASNTMTLLPEGHYYQHQDHHETYLDSLHRSELLDLIKELAAIDNSQRPTVEQIIVYKNHLQAEISRFRQEAAQSKITLDQAQIEIKRLLEEHKILQSEEQHLTHQMQTLHNTIAALQTSTSWRITKPLRSLSLLMSKSKRAPHTLKRQIVKIARTAYHRLPLSLYQRAQIKKLLNKIMGAVPASISGTLHTNPLTAAAAIYPTWRMARNALTPRAVAHMQAAILEWPSRPLLSIVMPVHNPPLKFLTAAIASVQAQLYEHWELCIADDASHPEVANLLRELAKRDQRIQLVRLDSNQGISGATNQALAIATGEWVGFLDHDDVLDPSALFFVARTLATKPETDIVYSDRDSITADDEHLDPYFKPDWSPLALLEHNYIIHFLVVRRTLLVELGGLRSEFDGAQDYDLVLRLAERTDQVQHIPELLYSWRRHPGSNSGLPKPAAFEAGRQAISAALERRGLKGTVELVGASGPYHVRLTPQGQPLISIIISSRNPKLLRACVEILRAKTTYPHLEILLATNAVGDAALQATCAALGLRLVEVENGFFSRMNNAAARAAKGEFVLFLNDDIEVISPDWIETLLALAQLPGVAAVGPRLVYPDGRTQLTRLVTGIRRDGHPYFFDPFDYYGVDSIFGFSLHVMSEVLGVSGGCMLTPRQLFLDSGGFEEETFSFSYQDADWTLRVRATGQSMVFTPHAVLVHYGQFSKRAIPDMMSREIQLARAFFTLHQARLNHGDPFWNAALLDTQGLLNPPQFPGQPSLPMAQAAPQVSHSLAECTPFKTQSSHLGVTAAAKAACRTFAERLVKATGCRTVVDVGCGVGLLVEALLQQGIDAWGLDQSTAVVAAALPAVRHRVVLETLGSGEFSPPTTIKMPFDIAVCTTTLERLTHEWLLPAIEQLADLAPNMVIITPKPNIWDRLDPTCCGLRARKAWLELFQQVGLREDKALSSALFGIGYQQDPDMTFIVLTRVS
jgi:GT2 family glycosyltransferase